jgi:hypothetical protein
MKRVNRPCTTFRIDPDLQAGLRALRERDGIRAGEAIRRALRDYLKKKGLAAVALLLLCAAPADASQAPLDAALALLGPNAANVPVTAVTPRRVPRRGNWPVWAARTDLKTVQVATDSRQWRAAERGDARALAAVVAHELWHVANKCGSACEAGAYGEQLRVLRDLGADRREIKGVEASRRAVVGTK